MTKFLESLENQWKLEGEKDGQLGLLDDDLAGG